MKTRCPSCHTVFRVTPEQLKARAGKVRCGQCQAIFNALDSLIEEPAGALSPPPRPAFPTSADGAMTGEVDILLEAESDASNPPWLPAPELPDAAAREVASDRNSTILPTDIGTPETEPHEAERSEPEEAGADEGGSVANTPVDDSAQDAARAAGLILPRETTEIPGYSKWSEGAVSAPPAKTAAASNTAFVLIALLLVLTLAGQALIHFRSEIAIAAPSLRPMLETMSRALNKDIPLPRNADLVSIEASDLQTDAARGNLLVLQATLRNRAAYAQAWPLLELSLTDTQDNAIVRRVFLPAEYLTAGDMATASFAAGTDIALRLWIDAGDVGAAGYRLYVFYP